MKRIILAIFVVVLAATGAPAASSVWKAQKGDAVIYLGGTIHVLREADLPLPPEFERAYRASQEVFFETDISGFRQPATQQQLLKNATYGDGSTIADHLSPRTYAELRSYCESNGIPLGSLERLKPSLLMVTLTYLELLKIGVTEEGVDGIVHGLAKKEKKPVRSLESIDDQVGYLLSMAEGNEDEFVSYSLRELGHAREQFETMLQAWRAGDAPKLDELVVADLKKKFPALYRKLILDRNRNWIGQIVTDRKDARSRFVVVGVGHLVGADGLIEELRKRGYRVDQL
jgi:uncharacterized protein YbaP (TraB family)